MVNIGNIKQKKGLSGCLIWIILFFLLIERLLIFSELGIDYNSGADDINYVPSGICFANTGVITYGGEYPSALIMPGMPVIIGLFALLFGESTALWVALRCFWCCLGVITAWYAYRTARICSNEWGGIIAACGFAIPNMAWMNHVILTETPYILFSTMCLFYTFAMGEDEKTRWFVGYLVSFLLALMFRSNIIVMPLFTLGWLVIRKKGSKTILLRGACLLGAMLIFVVPWTIRNYYHFKAFIPLTYGAGQPLLQGTYQGEGFPEDNELNYEENVVQVMHKKYPSFYSEIQKENEENDEYANLYDPRGEVIDLKYAQFLSMQEDAVKARYRINEWVHNDIISFLKSYLFIKPRWMLNWAWAWEEVYHISYSTLHRISQTNFIVCIITLMVSIWKKQKAKETVFLFAIYIIQVYICALAFVTDRYASSIIVIRYIMAGIGIAIIFDLIRKKQKSIYQ